MRHRYRSLRCACAAALLVVAGGAGAVADRESGRLPPSLYEQAQSFEHGEGVPRDPQRAASLYCASVREGSVEAMHALGWMYANGRGVERNDSLAGTLFAMAAMFGHAQAAAMLDRVGGHRGEVPDCLVTPPGQQAIDTGAGEDHWDLARFIESQPPAKRKLVELVARMAPLYAIDPRFALAVATTESGLDPQARSHKNAMGLMQLIPETAERFNVRDVYDPVQNVRGGLAYLRWLLAYFRGNVLLAAAGYNAGERAVDRYRGVPPYRETRDYVERIMTFFPDEAHPFEPGIVAASPVVAAELRGAGK